MLGGPDDWLQELVVRTQKDNGLVAVACGVWQEGKTYVAASGAMKAGADAQVKPDSRWHIGSNTKSITATLAGVLVDAGKIRWDSTVGEVLKELDPPKEFRPITLWQLLTHRSGLSPETYPEPTAPYFARSADMAALRSEYARVLFKHGLKRPPGEAFEYTNAGYVLAGKMLETVGKASWEVLVQTKVLGPLGATAHFGAEPSKNLEQPWPHSFKDGKAVPVDPALPDADNAPAVGPAGTINLTTADQLKYLTLHLGQGGKLLKPETMRNLHRPEGGYAGGWIVVTDQAWTGGPALTHGGSNTLNHQLVWVVPGRKIAIVVSANQGGPDVPKALNDLILEVIKARKL